MQQLLSEDDIKMSGRGNENRKMEARLNALHAKQEYQDLKSERERAQMERKCNQPFSIWAVGQDLKTFFKMNNQSKVSSFQVSLCKSIPLSEIRERMEKAFGDL